MQHITKNPLPSGRGFLLTETNHFDSIEHSYGRVAEWLGKGLQNPLLRFKSGRDLKKLISARMVELVDTRDSRLPCFASSYFLQFIFLPG